MALPSTLFRFRINLSDIDRGVYEDLDFRVAMHPSESPLYLVTRVIAFALNHQPGLEFTAGGLSDPAEPCMFITNPRGGFSLWIEIGNPSPKKLHKAAKVSDCVRVYTYKDPEPLLRDLKAEPVFRANDLEIFSLAPKFLEQLSSRLERDNSWSFIHTDGSLTINIGTQTEQGELIRH